MIGKTVEYLKKPEARPRRVRVTHDTGEETLTQQQFAADADANVIVQRFGLGNVPIVLSGVYGDFTGITDYESAFVALSRVEENFMRLSPEVRDSFNNDPQQFFEYAQSRDLATLERELGVKVVPEEPGTLGARIPQGAEGSGPAVESTPKGDAAAE